MKRNDLEQEDIWKLRPWIYSYMRRHGCLPDDAEDLATDVCIKAIYHLKNYDPNRCPLIGWISVVARSILISHIRKRSREVLGYEECLVYEKQ